MGGTSSAPPPAPAPVDNSAEEEKQARVEALERRRRGRSGTIHTSARGLIRKKEDQSQKKTLLGE